MAKTITSPTRLPGITRDTVTGPADWDTINCPPGCRSALLKFYQADGTTEATGKFAYTSAPGAAGYFTVPLAGLSVPVDSSLKLYVSSTAGYYVEVLVAPPMQVDA